MGIMFVKTKHEHHGHFHKLLSAARDGHGYEAGSGADMLHFINLCRLHFVHSLEKAWLG